jgi:GTPase SAR1 family protein
LVHCRYIILTFPQDISLISVGAPGARLVSLLTSSGDVGGQKTLRSYWRNYFEKTDALIWVVDATDRLRIDDCREELHGLLQEEV